MPPRPLRSSSFAALLLGLLVLGAAFASTLRPRDGKPPLHPHVERGQSWRTPETLRDALEPLQLAPGFRVELIAAEPLVEAPVWIAFDEHVRMWVVEMPGYMRDVDGEGEAQPLGRIVILEDADGDGAMDTRTVFADGLVMARGVLPCYADSRGPGALVIEPPHLLYLKDTDGDGRADQRRIVLSGFQGENPEHAPNALTWGLDNWIHLSQHTLELRFDARAPDRTITRSTPGHGQWGLALDAFGRLFYTPNSEALRMDVVPKRYASRHPGQRSFPLVNALVCDDQAVWPIHPTPGINRGYREDMLRDDRTLAVHTAACGTTFYDGSLFPPDVRGNAFVAEPAGNLVRRLLVEPHGDRVRARSVYDRREFLASADERFRPVQCAVGPEGALYVLDMHRGVIQHKTYLTDYLKDHIRARDLERPLHMGRVYRIVPADTTIPAPARLAGLSARRLVEQLAHPDRWRRITAQRLLIERKATDIVPALRRLAVAALDPVTRLHALWTLEGLGELNAGDVARALADAEPDVRIAALQLAEPMVGERVGGGGESETLAAMLALVRDDDARVRRQALLSLGESRDAQALAVLVDALEARPNDASLRAVVLSGLHGREADAILAMLDRAPIRSGPRLDAVREFFDAALASPDFGARGAAVDLIGRIATSDAALGAYLLGRLETFLRLASDRPRPLELAASPRAWERLTSSPGPLRHAAREADTWLVWPGHGSVISASGRVLTPAEIARFDLGRSLFNSTCAGCHGTSGAGAPGHAPALAGSSPVRGDPAVTIRVLLHGLEGPLESDGQRFSGSMPAAPFGTDEELAAVLTYIRRAWGNNADPVAPEDFAAARAAHPDRTTPWRMEELEPAPR